VTVSNAARTNRCDASNASEYLLTSRVRCGRCGQAYIGTAAHGRNGRYTYYTCFTRHRYGTEHCANDRLPADKLEQAVTRQLWKVLNDNDLLADAINHAHAQLAHRDGEHEDELSSVQRKLAEARAAMDRYFQAFEHGTMPEDTCAPRIHALGEQTKALEVRASELATLADSEPVQRIGEADLDAIRSRVRAALDDGGPMRVKAILQELTDEIRVDGRDAIEPTFLVPAVRPPSGSMEPTGIEPVTSCLQKPRGCGSLRVGSRCLPSLTHSGTHYADDGGYAQGGVGFQRASIEHSLAHSVSWPSAEESGSSSGWSPSPASSPCGS
jgi:site-specific DNA recombinase